jgi:hypothetical protein
MPLSDSIHMQCLGYYKYITYSLLLNDAGILLTSESGVNPFLVFQVALNRPSPYLTESVVDPFPLEYG